MSSRILRNKISIDQLKKAKMVQYSYPYFTNSSQSFVVEQYTPKAYDEVNYERYKENIVTGERKVEVSKPVDIDFALNKINEAIPQVTVKYYYKPKTATLSGKKTTTHKPAVRKTVRKPATRKVKRV